MTSNYTVLMGQGIGGARTGHETPVGQAAYFEGTNILVYIRGKQDDQGSFWSTSPGATRRVSLWSTLTTIRERFSVVYWHEYC
jgi:hypothetical protein